MTKVSWIRWLALCASLAIFVGYAAFMLTSAPREPRCVVVGGVLDLGCGSR